MKSNHYWLALTKINGLGPIRINKLLKHFGDPQSIWKASENQLKQVDSIFKLAEKIVEQRKIINIDKLLKDLDKNNIKYITLDDDNYPEQLKNIYDPPPVIYYKGNNILSSFSVAVIGSRRCTAYGRKTAEKISYELSQKGLTIVSGMARGIDTKGHIGSLKAKGNTVAVLGSGLDIIYPPESKELFNEIQNNGMVISEFPPGVEPVSGNFPQRNRIISGLSRGVIVIEAAARSGSLITADLALEQGRELFAVPGNINRIRSQGTNKLIQKGAKLVTGVDDVLEELFLYNDNKVNLEDKKNIYPELSAEEEELIKIFEDNNEIQINDIIEVSKKTAAEVNSLLL
ncbi:MAG: DNA-processing protein DprA, partial [Halanaerobiales bacterium]